MAKEILAMVLNTIHNVRYFMHLMDRIRAAIRDGKYREFKNSFLTDLNTAISQRTSFE
jgi:queuine tRNA-ribosyltransferase